jgi:hypothetical protein
METDQAPFAAVSGALRAPIEIMATPRQKSARCERRFALRFAFAFIGSGAA